MNAEDSLQLSEYPAGCSCIRPDEINQHQHPIQIF